jgi:hypothetical protein
MKSYLELYTDKKEHVLETVGHLFATLGNGVKLTNKGYLLTDNDTELYDLGNPIPLKHIYPWMDEPEHQPFRKYAGCRNYGFKETAQYFIDCIKLTPNSVENIKDWKENIDTVKDVLLNTPKILDQYKINELDKFLSDLKGETTAMLSSKLSPNSVYKQWYFNAQSTDCPIEVEDEVRNLWEEIGLGNDNYIYHTKVNQKLFKNYPKIYFWLKHKGVPNNEEVIIHWWW